MSDDTTDAVAWQPEFPGQRPPFEPGNALAVKHGAYSVRTTGPIAEKLVDAVLNDPEMSFLAHGSYLPALNAWAAAEAKVIVLSDWVDGMSIEQAAESKQGQVSPLELLRRWEANATTHRSRLGLDPLARARLGRDVAATRVDVASVLSQMREASEKGGTPDGN